MSLTNNPDEFFNKPLSIYPMTNPTPQTQPEPPAAGELSDADLTRIARDAELEYMKAHGGWTGLDPNGIAKQCQMADLAGHRAVAAAAIAADRARQSCLEGQRWEALRRLMQCLVNGDSFDSQVVKDVRNWIDAGMTGPLPPLPEHLASQQHR